jgi:hypothetical protein
MRLERQRAWRGGGGRARTVEIPRVTVPTNLRTEIVWADMVNSLSWAAAALIVVQMESFGVVNS